MNAIPRSTGILEFLLSIQPAWPQRELTKAMGWKLHALINQSSGLQAQSKETWDSSWFFVGSRFYLIWLILKRLWVLRAEKSPLPPLVRTSVLVLKLRTLLLEKTDFTETEKRSQGLHGQQSCFWYPARSWFTYPRSAVWSSKPTGKQRKHLRSWRSDIGCPLSSMPCHAARQQDFAPVAVSALSPAPRWIRSSIRTITTHFCLWANPHVPSLPGSVYQFLGWLGQHI